MVRRIFESTANKSQAKCSKDHLPKKTKGDKLAEKSFVYFLFSHAIINSCIKFVQVPVESVRARCVRARECSEGVRDVLSR